MNMLPKRARVGSRYMDLTRCRTPRTKLYLFQRNARGKKGADWSEVLPEEIER